MANYLPVLIVSVAANSIPDDSSVSTRPRGQVDYLSHDWEEEDVWRSWRNMTRQKNEIANGMRLENASWRTWWKRRNGLGTVTPETLNWLKDSDVTWLYGPLHTASDWAPPPKQIPEAADPSLTLNTPSPNCATHKPILKHRSISQLLTFSGPKLISPPQSDEDTDCIPQSLPPPPLELPREEHKAQRPPLSHTKSDTHITRWGSGRDFRRDPSPQSDPPDHRVHGVPNTSVHPKGTQEPLSSSNASSDSNPTTNSSNGNQNQKKRHISFNTFVEQYIAIDKPNKAGTAGYDDSDDNEDDEDDDEGGYMPNAISGRYPYGRNPWGYDDGYEEDEEEDSAEEEEVVSLSIWDEAYDGGTVPGSDSDSAELEGDVQGRGDDPAVRVPLHSSPRTKKSSLRSHSTVSTASSSSTASTSTSASTASTSSYASEPQDRPKPSRRSSTSTTGTYRPHLRPAPPSSSSSSSSKRRRSEASPLHSPTGITDYLTPPNTHVTIAPIAPTVLKTGTRSHYGAPGGWVEGFGDEGGSDDGLWGGGSKAYHDSGDSVKPEDGSGTSEGTSTPVELVYVPPLGSHYMRAGTKNQSGDSLARSSYRSQSDTESQQDKLPSSDQGTRGRQAKKFSVGDDESPDSERLGASVPSVVIRRPAGEGVTHDSFDYFVDADPSEERGRSTRSGSRRPATEGSRGRTSLLGSAEPSQSRSRSRSKSRTPSPAIISPAMSPSPSSIPSAPIASSHTRNIPPRKSASISPPSTSLLSPPLRGRGSRSAQDLQSQTQTQTRGRSSQRVLPSDRDRSLSQYSSPLGSLSPDGVELVGGYASGRLDKERGRSDRDRWRWREQSGSRSASQSLSPESLQEKTTNASSTPMVAPVVCPGAISSSNSVASSSSSSSSSAASVTTVRPGPRQSSDPRTLLRTEEPPTPSNSPVLLMHAVPANHTRTPSQSLSSEPQARKIKTPTPVSVSVPHRAEPSTSYSVSSPRRRDQSSTRSPSSPIRDRQDATIVGRAVEIVSSAGAFFGLWQHPGANE